MWVIIYLLLFFFTPKEGGWRKPIHFLRCVLVDKHGTSWLTPPPAAVGFNLLTQVGISRWKLSPTRGLNEPETLTDRHRFLSPPHSSAIFWNMSTRPSQGQVIEISTGQVRRIFNLEYYVSPHVSPVLSPFFPACFLCLCCVCHTAVIHQLAYAITLDFPLPVAQQNKFRLLFSLCLKAWTPTWRLDTLTCWNTTYWQYRCSENRCISLSVMRLKPVWTVSLDLGQLFFNIEIQNNLFWNYALTKRSIYIYPRQCWQCSQQEVFDCCFGDLINKVQ